MSVPRCAAWVLLALLTTLGLQPHTPVFIDTATPIAVDPGEEFFVALPSNQTTGFSWSQSVGDGKILAYEGNVYEPSFGGAMGAPGQQLFIYHANRSGSTTITFAYSRPFELGAPPAKTAAFGVTVR